MSILRQDTYSKITKAKQITFHAAPNLIRSKEESQEQR